MPPSTKKTCGDCNLSVARKDRSLKCDGCERWMHAECESISDKIYKIYNENQDVTWHCRNCKESIKVATSTMKDLELENKKLREILEEIKNTLKKEIKEEILNELRNERVNSAAKKTEFARVVEDLEEKRKRRENLVVFHLPESKEDEPQKREEEDKKNLAVLFRDALQVNDCGVTKAIRLGKRDSASEKSRPLLIKMRNVDEKWDILRKAKTLRDATEVDYRKIWIVKDQTKAEREIAKKRRMEPRRALNSSSPQTDGEVT